jgi:hypothetical protein
MSSASAQAAERGSRAKPLRVRGLNKWFGANHVVKDLDIEVLPRALRGA